MEKVKTKKVKVGDNGELSAPSEVFKNVFTVNELSVFKTLIESASIKGSDAPLIATLMNKVNLIIEEEKNKLELDLLNK